MAEGVAVAEGMQCEWERELRSRSLPLASQPHNSAVEVGVASDKVGVAFWRSWGSQ